MRPIHLIAALALATAAAPVGAQDPVQVKGTVVDEHTGEPIPTVDIVARSPGGRFLHRLTTDTLGRFQLTLMNTDGVRLYASRIGYEDNDTPILYFDTHSYFEVEIRLDASAVLLAPLEVTARRRGERSPVLSGFDRRLRNGTGYYISRKEIERRKPMLVSDLLSTVPGVRLESSGSGSRRVVTMARSASRNCPVQLFVDGLLVTQRQLTPLGTRRFGIYVDDFVTPLSVEGIEVYRGLSTVPPEFLTPEADCGVIAIWTRRGG